MTAEPIAEHRRLSGAQLFLRYAYPPNALGYCGPADSTALLNYSTAGVVDTGLVQLARGFTGAWPYLELIASATGIRDPLDPRVVEAYWIGNELLPTVGISATASSLEDRFRPLLRSQFSTLVDGVLAGAVPHHCFHVFGVYPWVGLLDADRTSHHALNVLDRCRIRWGRVLHTAGNQATVRTPALTWDGHTLALGPAVTETASLPATLAPLAAGDWVSLHWDWVCDRLTARQLATLRHYTNHQLAITNHHTPHPSLT